MAKKEAKTKGKYQYYRAKARHPVTGEYRDVYGKTKAERDQKKKALEDAWAAQAEDLASPFVYQYAADWYASASAHMSDARAKEVSREINNNICPVIGHLRLKDVTSDDLRRVMAARGGLSAAAQEKTRQVVKRLFRDAEEAGKCPRDPARNLQASGSPGKQKEALTQQQQDRLLDAVKGLPVELFCYLGLYAGLRREEICGLRWDCVDLDGTAPCIRVRRACRWINNSQPEVSDVLKSAAAWRTVPIPTPLVTVLAAEKTRQEAAQEPLEARFVVSRKDGGPWTYQTLRAAWGAVRARSTASGRKMGEAVYKHPDVKVVLDFPVTPHILRHTYITRLILGGVDLKRVQYLAGHSTARITLDIYTSLMGHEPEDLIADVQQIFG